MEIRHESGTLHYHVYAGGPKILIAFHGFGQSNGDFEPLITPLLKEYTIYSVDLFFHGKSHWIKRDIPLSKEVWHEIIQKLLTKHRIQEFSLMGFSLGGKFVFATLEKYAQHVDKLILLAPDGINTNLWYNLATYPVVFRKYFQSMIVKPHRFYNILNTFRKMRLADKGITKFAASQMNTSQKRYRVYYSWVVFKDLSFDLDYLAMLANEFKVYTHLWLGKYDKIITAQALEPFTQKLKYKKTEMLGCGHNDLISMTAQKLSNRS